MYDYQKRVIDALGQHRLIAVFKARAAGITELMLRYMGWLCLKDDRLQGTNMIVISAPAEDLSISFIRRLKAHHEPYIEFDTKEKVAILNGVRIEAFPSHNLRRLRGITDVSFVLAEESGFWNRSEEDELLPTILPLTQKSNPYIALVSTPGRLGGLMHRLSQEPEQVTRFKKVYIPYSDVVGKLFTKKEIEQAKLQPNFAREFDLQWGVGFGNVFNPADLQITIDLGKKYADPEFNPDHLKRPYPYSIYPEADTQIGVDPGAGSSLFAICGIQIWNQHCHVFAAEQYSRPHEDQMIERILQLWAGTGYNANIFIDAANPSFIKKLKSQMKHGEQVEVERQLQSLRKSGWAGKNDENLGRFMKAVPVPFNSHGPRLLQTAATYIQRQWVAIHPDFADLIEVMQAARTKENSAHDWFLDKNSHSLDLLDAYRLAHYDLMITNPNESEGVLA